MAIQDPFSPEMMRVLQTKGRFLEQASKAVNAFEKFPGPDGNYYAKLLKISPGFSKKTKAPRFIFSFAVIAYCENNSLEFANRRVQIQFYLQDGANSTEADAWERLYTQGYQALGCVTASWGGNPDALRQETIRLNTERPAVVLSITLSEKDKRYHNVNIREVLRPEAVSHFIQPTITVTDEELNEAAEASSPELVDESIVADFAESYNQAEQMVRGITDTMQLLSYYQSVKADVNVLDLQLASARQLQDLILIHYIKDQGKDPAEFGFGVPVTADLVVATNVQDVQSAVVDMGIEEVDDTAVALGDALAGPTGADIDAYLAKTDREGLKRGILVYNKDARFGKSQTDEVLRGILKEFMLDDEMLDLTIPF